jgi:acyl-CoA thioester hydrolase
VQQVEFPFVVARVAVDYKRPIKLADAVEAELWVSQLGRSSFSFRYRLWASAELAAEAETVQVHYDYATGKPRPIEGPLRERLEALLHRSP